MTELATTSMAFRSSPRLTRPVASDRDCVAWSIGVTSVLLGHEVAALQRFLVVVLALVRTRGQLDLIARHLFVRDQAQEVRDAVQPASALVVGPDDVPGARFRVGR